MSENHDTLGKVQIYRILEWELVRLLLIFQIPKQVRHERLYQLYITEESHISKFSTTHKLEMYYYLLSITYYIF